MVVYSLTKNASQIRQQVATSLVDICKGNVEYEEELNIEGMLCITMDKQQVLPIPFNIQLQKKQVRQLGAGGDNTTPTSSKDVPSVPSSLVFPPGTTISAPDLQTAQVALQSLLNKPGNEVPVSGEDAQPEFISLGDMSELEEAEVEETLKEASSSKRIKLENADEDDENNIEMGEITEDSQSAPTLQDTVGNAIKNFYQENNEVAATSSETPPRNVALTSTPVSGGNRLPGPITLIKVLKAPSPSKQARILSQQKIASSSLPWRKDSVKKFQCPLCSYTSDRRFCINRHMKLHVGRAGVQCHICKNVFADHWYLTKVHMPKHHANQVIGTDSNAQGGIMTKDPVTGNAVPMVAKETIIKCPVCPFTANSAISFRNHLNTHSRDCLRCGLRFLSPTDVQQHIATVHPGEEEEESCLFDPEMVDQLEEEAMKNAIRTPGTVPNSLQTSMGNDSTSKSAAEIAEATGGDEDMLVYNDEVASDEPATNGEDQQQVQNSDHLQLLGGNYMMVVNENNQVEFHSADGTVMEGIRVVNEDGQIYTAEEVNIDSLNQMAASVKEEMTSTAEGVPASLPNT